MTLCPFFPQGPSQLPTALIPVFKKLSKFCQFVKCFRVAITPMPNLCILEGTEDPPKVCLVDLLQLSTLENQFSSHYSSVGFPDYPFTKAIRRVFSKVVGEDFHGL